MIAPALPSDPLNRIDLVVDQDAEPTDLDEALAEFLLKIVSKRHSADPAAGDPIAPMKKARLVCSGRAK